MKWLSEFIEFLKLPFRILLFISILSGLLFFLPTPVRDFLLLTTFYQKCGGLVGFVFLVSSTYVLFIFIERIIVATRRVIIKKKEKKKTVMDLKNLSYREKAVLREFALQGLNVISVIAEDEAVAGLLSKKILQIVQRSTFVYIFGTPVFVRISENVKQYITFDFLGLKENPSKEDIKKYAKERPAFVNNLQGLQDLKNSVLGPLP
ncbi:MAG: superinfection exclusion B family protein [Spirochaetales bacterium]|nr:superinfection exclusion B family protein [Spirochaetales bacterium]